MSGKTKPKPSRSSDRRPPIGLRAAAEYCGMSTDWLKRRWFAGEISAIKTNYRLLFRPEELDRYLEEHTVRHAPRRKTSRAS
ncbi:MAG: hypothetical protein ACRDJ1_04285 [Actinomycetota bacterium]